MGWESALLPLAVLMALVNHAGTYESFELPKQLTLRFVLHTALAAGLAVWVAGWWSRGADGSGLTETLRRGVRWPPLVVAGVVLAAWSFVTLTSLSSTVSFWGTWPRWAGWWTQLHYVVLFCLAAATFTSRARVHRLAFAVAVGGGVAAAYAVIQNSPPPYAGFRPHSTFGNPNFMADYMTMGVPLGITGALASRRWWLRGLFIASVVLQLVAVLLTQTRGSWVALSLVLPLLLVLLVRRYGGPWMRAVVALALLGVLAVGTLYVFRDSLRDVGPLGRVVSILEARDTSASSRLTVWGTAIRLWLDRPLVGYGPDSFGTSAPRRIPPQNFAILNESNQELFDRAHSTTLDGLAAVGIVGMGSLAAVALLVTWSALRLLLPAGEEAEAARMLGDGKHLRGDELAIGAVVALFGYWVATQFSIESAGASSLAWMLGGLLVGAALRPISGPAEGSTAVQPEEDGVRPPVWIVGTGIMLVVAVAALSGWWEYREFEASVEFKRANNLARVERSGEAAAAYERSVQLWPFERRYWLELGFARRHAARTANEATAKTWLTQAVVEVDRSVEIDPENPLYLSKWADVAGEAAQRLQDPALAQRTLEGTQRALDLAPDRWLLWSDAGLTYLRLNKPIEARNALARALMLYDKDWVIFARYGDANAAVGDRQTARRAYQTALSMLERQKQDHQGVRDALARLGPE